MKYLVYELWNPIKNLPFYVGWAKRTSRPDEHINEALIKNSEFKIGSNPHKIYTIRKIIAQEQYPIVKIVFFSDSKKDSIKKEITLIKKYGRKDIGTGILTNMTDGGEGAGRRIVSEKQRKAMSKRKLGLTFEQQFGINRAKEIKEKISKKHKGKKLGPSWNTGLTKETNKIVRQMSESMKGHVPYNKNKKMININPNYINHFLGKRHSDKSKKLISEKNKGKTIGDKNGMYGKSAVKGRKWYNDGIKVFYLFPDNLLINKMKLRLGRLRT